MKILVAEKIKEIIGGSGSQPETMPAKLEEEIPEPEANNGSDKFIVPGVGDPGNGEGEEQDTLIDAGDESRPLQ